MGKDRSVLVLPGRNRAGLEDFYSLAGKQRVTVEGRVSAGPEEKQDRTVEFPPFTGMKAFLCFPVQSFGMGR